MKITRYKKVQKHLSFYFNNYGFRQPYQVLIDGTFCFAARQEQINIKEQLPKYLSSDVKLLSTKCVIVETETIAKKTHGALTVLKQFGIHQCNHREPIVGSKCLLSMVGKHNDNHYLIATQDRDLQDKLRQIPGTPLIYLHNKAPTLERPSEKSHNKAHNKLEHMLTLSSEQQNIITELKKTTGILPDENEGLKKKKKKKRRGPNPMSCKKKKSKPQVQSGVSKADPNRKIRKRLRKKIPAHIKDKLKSVLSGTVSS